MADNDLNSYSNIRSLKYYTKLSFSTYARPSPFDNAEFKAEKHILLPLPLELRDDTAVNYNSNDNLQLAGDILNNGGLGGGAIQSELLRRSGDIGSKMAQGLVGGAIAAAAPSLAEAGGDAVATALPASQVTSAISQALGQAPNPNPSVTFQGPQLRDLNLSWTLVPTTKADSINIRKIINYLKASALPTNSISKSAAILDYPKLVQVNFYPWDRGGRGDYGWSDRSIIKMKRCFMGAVNVNYTPSNTPAFFHDTNEPIAIQLSISLKEVEYFLSSDYGGAAVGKGSPFENISDLITSALGFSDQTATDQGTAPEAQAAPS
jgi:hypothetical protein